MYNERWLRNVKEYAQEHLDRTQRVLEALELVEEFCEHVMPKPEPAPVEEVRQGARKILAIASRPMHRRDLHDELQAHGIHVGGKDPVASLGSVLSRFDKDFIPHGEGKWGLTEIRVNGQHSIKGENLVDELTNDEIKTIRREAWGLLTRASTPINCNALHSGLRDLGIRIPGESPTSTLNEILGSAPEHFVAHDDMEWGVRISARSGDTCRIPGVYATTCGHPARVHASQGQPFPCCPADGAKVEWTMQQGE